MTFFYAPEFFLPYRCLLATNLREPNNLRGESFFCSAHLLQGLALKQQLFLLFGFLRRQLVCFLDAFRHSLLLLVAVVFTVVSLSVIHCRPSRPFHSLTSASPAVALPFSRLLRLPVAVVGFLVVLLFRRRPLIRSLQLVVAIVGLPLAFTSASNSQCRLIVVQRVLQESYKSSYRSAR